ncbi:MAG: hypothetical protein LUD76_12920, partial [Alistipes sp.]|nr:hypothetical protein [Alistipes sp.]
MEDRNNNGSCDACEQDFMNEVNELVDNVENHSKQQYEEKEREVEDAFGNKGDQCQATRR